MKIRKKHAILSIIFILIIAIIITFSYIKYETNQKYTQIQKIPMDIKVANYIGFNLDKDAMHFGATFPGGGSKRNLSLINNDVYNKKVLVEYEGRLKDFVNVSENNFILKPNENKTLEFTVMIPQNTELGNYTGTIILTFKRTNKNI